jgi:DNA-binding transcriptional LysR family regulator
MEIYQFRQLIAIAEARSFKRAAMRLGLTQPALSAGIRKLETELGVRLFDRASDGVKLTSYGKVVAARARQVLETCAQVYGDINLAVERSSHEPEMPR